MSPPRTEGQDSENSDKNGGAAENVTGDSRPSDEEILKYQKEILKDEIAKPLISRVIGFEDLKQEYASGLEVFRKKVDYIASTCSGMRAVRKDGSCFYRAFSFRLCELLWEHAGSAWHAAAMKRIEGTKDLLSYGGYDQELLIDFYEVFETAMAKQNDPEKLLEILQNEYTSDATVAYIRVVAGAIMMRDRDMYEAFVLDSYPTIEEFIAAQVAPVGVEADQIQIAAISNAFGIPIHIANLDPTQTAGEVNYHEITPMEPLPVDQQYSVVLLYRPGHYEILYRK
ncbi:OTU domain, ubiquitin aldehyde binding [Borealophlyctis nickersoniae]|nr:OTU domain, ubiquitin aldehyde binding [Borealophlyctis nickersoniae]